MAAGVLGFLLVLFGFIWYSGRIKNRVDRRDVSSQDVLTATEELQRNGGKLALATMCIGVGQGIALALERV